MNTVFRSMDNPEENDVLTSEIPSRGKAALLRNSNRNNKRQSWPMNNRQVQ